MLTRQNTRRGRRHVRRPPRYSALQVLLIALAVLLVGNEAEAVWLRPLLTHLVTGR